MIPACTWGEDCKDDEGVARVHADPRFPPAEQASIQSATHRWNAFAGHVVILAEANTYNFVCTIIDSADSNVDGKAQGVEEELTGNIKIASVFSCNGEQFGRYLPCFEALVLHEMGHLLGMKHLSPGVDGVMRPVGTSLDFTQGDRMQCLAIDLCSR